MALTLRSAADEHEYAELVRDIALLTRALRGYQPPRRMMHPDPILRTSAVVVLNHVATLLTTGNPSNPRVALAASITAKGIMATAVTTGPSDVNAGTTGVRCGRGEEAWYKTVAGERLEVQPLETHSGRWILAALDRGPALSFQQHATDVLSIVEAVRCMSPGPSDTDVAQFLIFVHMRSHRALADRLISGQYIWPAHPLRLLSAWAHSPARTEMSSSAVVRVINPEVSSWLAERCIPSPPGGRGFILDEETIELWADALLDIHNALARALLDSTGVPRNILYLSVCPDLLAALNRLRTLLECGLINALIPSEHCELSSLLWTPPGSTQAEWFDTPVAGADSASATGFESSSVDPGALRGVHETTAQHLTRYLRSLTAWFDSVLDISGRGRIPLPVHVRIIRIPRSPFIASNAARRAALADGAPQWWGAQTTAYVDALRLSAREVDEAPVHAEAALLGLVYAAAVQTAARKSPLAACLNQDDLRALHAEFSVESLPTGLAGQCCWTCGRLYALLRHRSLPGRSMPKIEGISLTDAHGAVEPWTPPTTPRLPVEVLTELREELFVMLQDAAAVYGLGDGSGGKSWMAAGS